MEKRTLGRTGLEVTALGFGSAEIGYQNVALEIVEAVLGEALDAGLNVIDTAECYGTGEELIGKAVSHRRAEYHLFTKCGHASGLDGSDWDVAMLERSIERSLRRLQTDHVELLQLHSCSEEKLRQGDVIVTLQRARDAGKTRFIGYSGDGAAALYAVQSGAFDTLQTSVSIADQESIALTLPAALERRMGVIAKRPIANAVWRHDSEPQDGYVRPYWQRLQALDYAFLKGDATNGADVALRFTLSSPGVCTAIVGTTRPGRWGANAALAAQGPLPAAEYRAIRERWAKVAAPDWTGRV